ncbi:phosphoribosyltransferase-like protein [Aliarcobacter butzleri]|uniref:AAA family ATPase n=1 Tax=Aliarcobacter butzleri TaxID=28197 RepID=A0AAW7Q4G7_9BACT|nr:AAA family ATPase [Aliarcobacter butzleri]MDN5114013.1 AAA family ATPase [Aliarcobacter butzleri]
MSNKDNLISKISIIIRKNSFVDNRLDSLKNVLLEYFELNSEEIKTISDLINHVKEDRVEQEFLAAIFLRIYNNHEELIESDNTLKHKVISLFDIVFEHSIYKRNKILIKSLSHEKLPLIKHYIQEVEETINRLSIDNLANFNSYRGKYFKLLKGSNEKIIKPFLDETIYNEIEHIFKEIETYINNQDLQFYNELIKKLEKYIDTLIEIDSEYNNLFLLTPLNQLTNLIKNDFKLNHPEAKISKLIISSTGKRYPLSDKNINIDLLIKLSNKEDGIAYDTSIEIVDQNILELVKTKQYIGNIYGQKTVIVKFNAIIKNINKRLKVRVNIKWKDFTQKEYEDSKELTFYAQKAIDWDEFESKECYSREAIENEDELIGRKDILDELFNGIDKNKNIKSYYIHGQKRTGKTSIAKVLKERFSKNKEKILVLYIEGGEYVDGEDFRNTVNNLGKKICKQILKSNQKLSHLYIPNFNGSLQPLVDFLDDVTDILSDIKVVFMLDEFDEISSNLYKRNEIGNAFFLTIRSISNKPDYSFILIGGEKINFIISIQGEQLNKFKSHRVDYFDKEHWSEFKDLVKKPVEKYLDITDQAINLLYEETAGNPFFTNVICETMMKIAIFKKDSFITDTEMIEAISKSVEAAEPQIFSHFWEDGIKEDNDKEEEISYKRRKILLTLSELEKNNISITKDVISDKLIEEISELEIKNIINEFIDRTILIDNDGIYSFRINFFKHWLLNGGSSKIILTLSEEEKIRIREKEEEKAEITSIEISEFIKTKQIVYCGNTITTDEVRNWLNQFDSNIDRRLIFKILQNLRYFSSSNIKIKMKEIFSNIKNKKYTTTNKVTNVLVSYLDGIGKSGVEYAKYFIDENLILVKNSIEKNKILEKLNKENFDYLVFVDDFTGTGQTIVDFIKQLKKDYPDIFNKEIEIIIGIVAGFLCAKEFIENELDKLKINNIKIIICEPLNESDKCFSDESKIYTNPDERRNAKDICLNKGYSLVKKDPLGFGNCEATVLFPDTCPNNSLPILWAEDKDFKPLFKRKIN